MISCLFIFCKDKINEEGVICLENVKNAYLVARDHWWY